jgi:ribosomal protein S18 acetylase RimI-like enzyme
MTSEITFEKLKESEISKIQSLAHKTWWETYKGILKDGEIEFMLRNWYSDDYLLNDLLVNKRKYYLVKIGSQEVGFFSFGLESSSQSMMRLGRIYILKETQGRGVGRKIIDFVENRIKDCNCDQIILNVHAENDAVEFYKKVGFKVLKNVTILIPPYIFHDYVMGRTYP